MDTERFFSTKDIDIEKVNIFVLDDKDKESVEAYIELTRHMQELKQLFDVFRFNLETLLNFYDIYPTDKVERKPGVVLNSSDFIAINALTTNLISAGRAVADSAEVCMKKNYGETSGVMLSFKENCLSKVYDENFGYRFLYHMRNFSQHLHLPVSCSDGRYSFDLWQILNTPHVKRNAALKQELSELNQKAMSHHDSVFHLSYCITLAQYTCAVSFIYIGFLKHIKRRLFNLKKDIVRIVAHHPDALTHEDERFNGSFLYLLSDDDTTLHMFAPNDRVDEMYRQHLKEGKKFYCKQKKEHDIVIKGVKWKEF